MDLELKLPELGDGIDSADIISILVKKGDKISKEDTILEVETDKATVEVPSDVDGIIEKLLVKEGDTVNIGQNIAILTSDTTKQETVETEKPQKNSKKEMVSDVGKESKNRKQNEKNTNSSGSSKHLLKLPDLGDGIEKADVLNVLIKAGDIVDHESIVIELETDKATVDVPAGISGKVSVISVATGDTITIGQSILEIETSEPEVIVPLPQPAKTVPIQNENGETNQSLSKSISQVESESVQQIIAKQKAKPLIPASPAVRRFAREIGVKVEEIHGTGPSERITFDDIKAFAKDLNSSKNQIGARGGPYFKPLPNFEKYGPVEKVKMTKIRQVTAKHMSLCWNTIPHVTQFDEADITDMEALRQKHKERSIQAGGKLTITAILIKICAMALKKFPQFNATLDIENNEILYKKHFNIGVAVDTPNGLIVPVIAKADQKSLLELSKNLGEISKKARDRKITPADLSGGCFSISNLGGISGTAFKPIVNWPEVAILGVGKSSMKPVYLDGEFQPRLIMPLSLSYDHRLIDGADGARFLAYIKEIMEDAFLMSLGI